MSDFENIGVNSSAGADGTADKAFDLYKKGASIEEINNVLFGNDNGPVISAPNDTQNAGADDVTYGNGTDTSHVLREEQAPPLQNKGAFEDVVDKNINGNSQNGADSVVRRATDDEKDLTGAASSDERLVSQNELDSLVGRRLAKERRAHDRVKGDLDTALDEIAKYLGVSREEALLSIKKANYKKEAEENNISDAELYEKLKIAEEKNAEYENAENERKALSDIEDFKNTITSQIQNLSLSENELSRASADNDFNSLVKYFYDNPLTRGECVSLAYNMYARGKGTLHHQAGGASPAPTVHKIADVTGDNGTPHPSATADTFPSMGRQEDNDGNVQKPKRAQENASSAGTGASSERFDVDNMKLEDYEKINERVKNGETIYF